eukprot:jgi/Tetstr1/425622/TSEL_016042.t1
MGSCDVGDLPPAMVFNYMKSSPKLHLKPSQCSAFLSNLACHISKWRNPRKSDISAVEPKAKHVVSLCEALDSTHKFGSVAWYNQTKGFGKIQTSNGQQVFVAVAVAVAVVAIVVASLATMGAVTVTLPVMPKFSHREFK